MKRELFAPAPVDRWNQNAIAGGQPSAAYAYISGYYEAADRLTETALTSGPRDTLLFPICFNYRHYVELALKHLIIAAEDYHSVLDQLGQTEAKSITTVQPRIVHEHSLQRLLDWLVERLELVTDTKLSPGACATIQQLHKMDPTGQTFRYPFKKDGSLMLPEQRQFDLANIHTLMQEVETELSGVDVWLEYNTDQAVEYCMMLEEQAADDSLEIDF